MKVKMVNLSPYAVFVPGGLELSAGGEYETEVKPEFGWAGEAFEATIREVKRLVAQLREATYAHLRIGPRLMAVRI